MNGKGYKKEVVVALFLVQSQYFLGGTERSHEIFGQVSQFPGKEFKKGPPKYKAGVVTT